MSTFLLLIPFVIQMVAIGIDEICFHLKREVPKWERIGHPLDTLSVLSCFVFVLTVPFSSGALKIFIALALLSCLLITKDEFVHKHLCPIKEMWLHAVLFVNHSILLTALGLIWAFPSWLSIDKLFFTTFLLFQTLGITLFMLYQIIYWNFVVPHYEKKSD